MKNDIVIINSSMEEIWSEKDQTYYGRVTCYEDEIENYLQDEDGDEAEWIATQVYYLRDIYEFFQNMQGDKHMIHSRELEDYEFYIDTYTKVLFGHVFGTPTYEDGVLSFPTEEEIGNHGWDIELDLRTDTLKLISYRNTLENEEDPFGIDVHVVLEKKGPFNLHDEIKEAEEREYERFQKINQIST